MKLVRYASPGSVVMDVVRTDLHPDRHLNFTLEIPVIVYTEYHAGQQAKEPL